MVPPFLLRHKSEQVFEVKSVAGRQYEQHMNIYLYCVLCNVKAKGGTSDVVLAVQLSEVWVHRGNRDVSAMADL